ncbi:hypothetical protein [Pedobacter glucosidilyticus]|uniref:hypothetical protein n=1 Tax=Pedobacter glucosidilyticus TaxID=1122941 RepID=UPI0026F07CAE|nr:hypothetical protein [Pedobacter glucosidilyticus]
METLKKYNISFAKVIIHNTTHNRVHSNNSWLSLLVKDHKTISDANRLLDGINTAINENWQNSDWGYPTQGMVIAIIDSDYTKIYEDLEEYANNKSISPSFTLPTLDFKEIVEAWIQYLQNNS